MAVGVTSRTTLARGQAAPTLRPLGGLGAARRGLGGGQQNGTHGGGCNQPYYPCSGAWRCAARRGLGGGQQNGTHGGENGTYGGAWLYHPKRSPSRGWYVWY
jgi:hypothetical protein